MKTPSQEISDLQNRIKSLQVQVDSCPHIEITEPVFDPETVKEPYEAGMIQQGVDFWPDVRYRDKVVDRWSKTCKRCGKVFYTYKQKPVISKFEPDFK
jgi:hypothetical protein